MPQFIFRPVIVDRHTDVVLLYELLNPRQSLRRRVARDNHANPRPLAVFEFAPDVRIFIFREINGSGSVKLDARRGIICQRGLLLLGIYGEMIFDVLGIQRQHVELLQEADHLRPAKITERVAGHPQTNRRSFVNQCSFRGHCENFLRSNAPRRNQCTGADEIAARKDVFHLHLIAWRALPHLRHAVPTPSHIPAPTSSLLQGRPESVRLWCPDATPG